jgi:biopolymer transport protein ExbD
MIPIASMGDIAFLLIIFFMLTSNFIQEAHIRLTPASAMDVSALKTSPVTVSMDLDGEVWLQGQVCPVEALEFEVSALLEGKDNRLVVVKVDKDLPESKYGPVLMALSKAGADIGLIGRKTEP